MELVWENGQILTRSLSTGKSIALTHAEENYSARNLPFPRSGSCQEVEREENADHNNAASYGCGCPSEPSCNFLLLSGSRPNAVALMATPDSVNHQKRNFWRAPQDSESHCNDDDQSDNVNALLAPPSRAKGMKRKRAAQVHKRSEKRRRDKINKRLRTLQDLLPNCTKVDKASVLDEAIEYLKSLQLQLQIMSIFGGSCVPPTQMMLPAYYPAIGMGARCSALQLFSSPFVGYGTGLQMPMYTPSMMSLRRSAQ